MSWVESMSHDFGSMCGRTGVTSITPGRSGEKIFRCSRKCKRWAEVTLGHFLAESPSRLRIGSTPHIMQRCVFARKMEPGFTSWVI